MGTTTADGTATSVDNNTSYSTSTLVANVTGDLNGYIRDPNGNVILDNGTVAGATPNFGGNVSGDVTGNVLTTDANGNNPSIVLNANAGSSSAAIFTGDVTGDVTGTIQTATQNSITTMTDLIAVGKTEVNTTFTGPVVASEGVTSNGDIIVGTGTASGIIQSYGSHGLTLKTGNTSTEYISLNTNAIRIDTSSASGVIQVVAPTIEMGKWNEGAILTTLGTGNLSLNTDSGASMQINDTANGDITMTPNGTGKVDIQGPVTTTGVTTTGNVTMTGKFIKQF